MLLLLSRISDTRLAARRTGSSGRRCCRCRLRLLRRWLRLLVGGLGTDHLLLQEFDAQLERGEAARLQRVGLRVRGRHAFAIGHVVFLRSTTNRKMNERE